MDYFNDLTMIVNVNPGNEGIIQFEKDGNIIDNGEVSGDYLIKYIHNKTCVIDSFTFSIHAKDKQFSNEEIEFNPGCLANIVVCGVHCEKCDEYSNFYCQFCEKGMHLKKTK